MLRKPNNKGFTLIELMVVIAIIVVLITLFILGVPAVMNMAKKVETTAKISTLQTKITQYGRKLPEETEMKTNSEDIQDVDNSRFLEALQKDISGITEDDLVDGWGNPIMYDRLWEENPEVDDEDNGEYDEDPEEEEENEFKWLLINANLPGHPVIRKCNKENWKHTDEILKDGDMQREFSKYTYVLWSLGEKIYLDDDEEEEWEGGKYYSEDDIIKWGVRGSN